jgi:hypothetical protein
VSNPQHDHTSLGAYALGVLTPREATDVEAHLRTCPDGRREVSELVGMRAALDTVPPEAFIDGPPPGGDLLLQRTLRRMRTEPSMAPPSATTRPSMGRRLASVAAVVAIAGGALVGGIFIGQGDDQVPDQAGIAFPEAKDQSSGATMDVKVEPLAGWVKVHAKVSGIKQGEQCQLIVTARDNSQKVAGSWLVSEAGESGGTTLSGPALVAPKDVKSVDVITFDGRRLISVPVTL